MSKDLKFLIIGKFILLFFVSACNEATDENTTKEPTTITDARDQQTYDLYKADNQSVWLKSDLNYKNEASYESSGDDGDFSMYSWNKAMNACPEGYRLPSRADWKMLLDQFPDGDDEGNDNTTEAFNGLQNEIGFNLKARGMFVRHGNNPDSVENKGADKYGYYWTSTEGDDGKAFALRIDFVKGVTYLQSYDKRGIGSCRCIKAQ